VSLRRVRRFLTSLIAPALLLVIAGYFGWSATQGDHGSKAYQLRLAQRATLESQLHQIEAERDMWQVRVDGLQANHIDADTLDERARAMLNLVDPQDIVVPYGANAKLYNDHQ